MNKTRVLTIDNDPRITEFIRMVLKARGYEVETENIPANAKNAARAFKPDIILLDVAMPGKDGGDVAQELRLCPATAHIPVVFVTSIISDMELGGAFGELGGDCYLAKPVLPEFLIRCVQQRLAVA